jgi:hypothetical protein
MPPSPNAPLPGQTNVATAADYADAMLIGRKARTIFAYLLILILVLQLALFITFRFSPLVDKFVTLDPGVATPTLASPTTAPAAVAGPSPAVEGADLGRNFLKYLVSLSGFFGLMFSILLSLSLLLLLNIMLIGRLIGISKVTSAFIWSLVVLTFIFPWQAFLNNESLTRSEFKVPGVLYNWNEFVHNANIHSSLDWHIQLMRWARFLAMPAITVVLVLTVLGKSSRGLRLALGESTGSSSKPKKKKDKYEDEFHDEPDQINDRNILT